MATWLVIAVPLAWIAIPNAIALALIIRSGRHAEAGARTPESGPGDAPAESVSADDLEALWRLPAYRERAL